MYALDGLKEGLTSNAAILLPRIRIDPRSAAASESLLEPLFTYEPLTTRSVALSGRDVPILKECINIMMAVTEEGCRNHEPTSPGSRFRL